MEFDDSYSDPDLLGLYQTPNSAEYYEPIDGEVFALSGQGCSYNEPGMAPGNGIPVQRLLKPMEGNSCFQLNVYYAQIRLHVNDSQDPMFLSLKFPGVGVQQSCRSDILLSTAIR